MVKRMLIDAAHEEEMRVAVVDGNRLEDFDFESKVKKQIKGNIYLAKVTRVEPSLQACFVEYGGNRQGFLAFSEIHPDYYRIPVEDREALLEEERRLAELEEEEAAIEDEKHEDVELSENDVDNSLEENSDVDSDDDDSDKVILAENEDKDQVVVSEPVATENVEIDNSSEEEKSVKRKRTTRPRRKPTTRKSLKVEEKETGDVLDGEQQAVVLPVDAEGGNIDNHDVDEESHEGRSSHRKRKASLRKRYKIQEVITRRQIMLVQVTKEERGNKGAALTSYISLPGRYCVLMPNSPRGGGISRKISNPKDRRRMREIINELETPKGMSVILRTAGLQRKTAEIKRDLDYLLRMWDNIRQSTLESTAPSLIYEEGDLAKRAIRDLYSADVDEILVNEDVAYREVKEFMKMLIPSHSRKVKMYKEDSFPLFHRYQVENQIEEVYKPEVRLKSGGYIVINPTEALVSIDVNSGKSTRERNIDETALKTNLEAAEEVARQLRLRDLGGLVVVDFIDMENHRHNMKVERKMRDAMANDRARVEVGRLSQFGLLELSRQRLRPSFSETHFEVCPHCAGVGMIRTVESASVVVLRELEEEGVRSRAEIVSVSVPTNVALYLLNQKREMLASCEKRYGMTVFVRADDELVRNEYRIEPIKARDKSAAKTKDVPLEMGKEKTLFEEEKSEEKEIIDETAVVDKVEESGDEQQENRSKARRNNNRRRRSPYGPNPRNNKDRNAGKREGSSEIARESSTEERVQKKENKVEKPASVPSNNAPANDTVKSETKTEEKQIAPKKQVSTDSDNNKPLVIGSDAGVQSVNQKPEKPKKGWWKKLVD